MEEKTEFDLEAFRLSAGEDHIPNVKRRVSKQRIVPNQTSDWFIKGPIPGSWIGKAANLSGHTLHVALTIFYVSGLKSSQTIIVGRFHFDRFGVNKDMARRGLIELQKAGLITYSKAGQKFQVTICNNEKQ